ncbi:MAG: hypothetical protein BGO55_07480 [Sphingobacteriales bacterium 50-39]|nr:MAG: hypothetical protein BGO55_07480 [Sphingobacteriales bacterium 50-39]
MHKKLFALLLLLFGFIGLMAQTQPDSQHVEMADQLRANGKIYVVVVVLIVILLGLILYVVRLDKKITRLEKGASRKDS